MIFCELRNIYLYNPHINKLSTLKDILKLELLNLFNTNWASLSKNSASQNMCSARKIYNCPRDKGTFLIAKMMLCLMKAWKTVPRDCFNSNATKATSSTSNKTHLHESGLHSHIIRLLQIDKT